MSVPGDSDYQMPLSQPLDDEAIEAIVGGGPVDARLTRFVALAESVRTLGDEPLPPPSPALEAVFAGERRYRWPAGGAPSRRVGRVAARVAGLGLVAKAALGASTAGVVVVAAGASGALPATFDQKVRSAIEAVTPIEFDDSGASEGPDSDGGTEPGGFGDRVSRDATGESDGQPGVDGDDISDEAPGAEQRPDQPGSTGLDQADETPAGPNLPDGPGDPDGDGGEDDGDGPDDGDGDGPDDADDAGSSDDGGRGNSGNTPGATAPGSTAPGGTAPGRPASGATTMNQPMTSTDDGSGAMPSTGADAAG